MYTELFIIALEISELVNERKKLHHMFERVLNTPNYVHFYAFSVWKCLIRLRVYTEDNSGPNILKHYNVLKIRKHFLEID